MSYTATLVLNGNDSSNCFYTNTITVSEETVGATLDSMVAAAIVMSKQLKEFVDQNFGSNYQYDKHNWYLTASYPSGLHPSDDGVESNNIGSGGSISSDVDLVRSITHYRHMTVEFFFKEMHKMVNKGMVNYYEENPPVVKSFHESYRYRNLNRIAECGFLGTHLDEVIGAVPAEVYTKFAEVYTKRFVAKQKSRIDAYSFAKKNETPVKATVKKTFKQKLVELMS